MTLLELVKLLRESFLDDTGGTGIDWVSVKQDDFDSIELRWTNEELTSHINEAIRQVYRRILPVQKFESDFDISVTANTHTYSLDSRIIRIIGAKLSTLNKQLLPLDLQDLWLTDKDWETRTGNPTHYIVDYETKSIRLYPIPIATDTLKLFINRYPLEELDWECNQDEPELRTEWQYPMLNWALHLAYLKDEANTFDPEKAERYAARFNVEFPQTSAYSDLRKSRTNHREIRYGGVRMDTDVSRNRNPYGSSN